MAHTFVDSPGQVRLAQVPPFRLGAVEVRPATRQLVCGEMRETLEPRVMQVLVALAQAGGEVISRDELIERCWDGRIVSDHAINRVISRLRQVAAETGLDSFQLETITKVGYRIVVAGAPEPPVAELRAPERAPAVAPPPRIGRRAAIAGAAAAALGAGGWWWIGGPRGGTQSAEARALYERGLEARREGLFDQERQAGAYFRRAVEIDPAFAEAWGALALAYVNRIGAAPPAEQAGWTMRSRSAAERALALDPGNADARVALILVRPSFRNWQEVETACRRALAEGVDHPDLIGALGELLMEVGRCREAVAPIEALFVRDRLNPTAHYARASVLLGAGRLQESEDALDNALKLWPSHPDLWFSRFYGLAYSGRPGAAVAMASDRTSRPFGYADEGFELAMATARALDSGAPEAADAVIARRLGLLAAGRGSPGLAAQQLAAFGRPDEAFTLLRSYYFGGGPLAPKWPAPGPHTQRNSAILFLTPLDRLQPDPRFAALTRDIGLGAYWRATGSLPDYLRRT